MLLLGVISFFCGLSGAWLIAQNGVAAGLADSPNKRSSHTTITPKGGGIGLLLAFLIVSFSLNLDIYFILPVLAVSVSGLIDDRLDLPPFLRLGVQFFSAYMLVFSTNSCYIPFWLMILWTFYIAGTANCYNFMDGINGIAAVTAITAFVMISVYIHLVGTVDNYLQAVLCMGFACVGFLPFNFPKASVFMGDTGSILLGFLFGAIIFKFSKNINDFFILASFLFPFYCDELTTMILRIKKGENLFLPHRTHVYQILANEAGMSHLKVTGYYFLMQVLVGISMILFYKLGTFWIFFLLVLFFIIFSIISTVVRLKYNEAN